MALNSVPTVAANIGCRDICCFVARQKNEYGCDLWNRSDLSSRMQAIKAGCGPLWVGRVFGQESMEHGRINGPRRNGVNPDIVLRELNCLTPRQGDQSPFGGSVNRNTWMSIVPGHTGHMNDRSRTGSAHMRNHEAGE